MYVKSPEVLAFDQRLSREVHKIGVGEYLKGSWPQGASVRLPPSGDGGKLLDYARQGHPGADKVERLLAALEMGKSCVSFVSGQAAMQGATEALVSRGDTVLVHSSVYGGTIRYFNFIQRKWGVDVRFVDLGAADAGVTITETKPKLIVLESVTNPALNVLDMPGLMRAAARTGSYMIVDNTLPTSYGCVPLDIARHSNYDKIAVVLSTTKGCTAGDLGGAVIGDDQEWMEKVYAYRQMASAPVAQTDAPRLHDAIKDMDMRMQRLGENSQAIAQYLDADRPEGIQVLYPFLKTFQDYARARELLLRAPGVFTLKCTLPQGRFDALAQRVEEVYLQANSFNGKLRTSSISHIQSHKSVGDSDRQAQAGITPQLIRLSPSTVDRPESAVQIMREIINDWGRNLTISSAS